MNRLIVRYRGRFIAFDRRRWFGRRLYCLRYGYGFGFNRFRNIRNRWRPDLRDRRKHGARLVWKRRFGLLWTLLLNQRHRFRFWSCRRRLRLRCEGGFFAGCRSRRRFRPRFWRARFADRRHPGAPHRPMLMLRYGLPLLWRDQIGRWLRRRRSTLISGTVRLPRGLRGGFFSSARSCNHE
jgi:hypothetical protein